jgi:transcription initiation factor IIE alpha subunit
MEENKIPEKEEEQETRFYTCAACQEKFEVSEARRREFACCGQRLLPLEVITKSDPTPFAP